MGAGVTWLTTAPALSSVSAEWRALTAGERLFEQPEYISWSLARTEDQPAVAVLRDERGALAAVCPLQRSGSTLRAVTKDHGLRVPATDPHARRVLLAEVFRRPEATIDLAGLDEGLAEEVAACARAAGRLVVRTFDACNLVVDPAEGHASWAGARPMKDVARRRRQMHQRHEVRTRIFERPTDLDADIDAFLELEAAGWKGAAGTALALVPGDAQRFRSLLRTYHELGAVRVSSITLDGQLAALDLGIDDDRAHYALKSTFNESFRNLGTGMLLNLECVERCFETGLAYDMGPDLPYKRRFSNLELPMARVRAHRRRPRGLARWTAEVAGRPLARRGRGLLATASAAVRRQPATSD